MSEDTRILCGLGEVSRPWVIKRNASCGQGTKSDGSGLIYQEVDKLVLIFPDGILTMGSGLRLMLYGKGTGRTTACAYFDMNVMSFGRGSRRVRTV